MNTHTVRELGDKWDILLKVSLVLGPMLTPFILGLSVWLVSEAFATRDFRSRGTRFTREEHLEYKQANEVKFQALEKRQDKIIDSQVEILKSLERLNTLIVRQQGNQ